MPEITQIEVGGFDPVVTVGTSTAYDHALAGTFDLSRSVAFRRLRYGFNNNRRSRNIPAVDLTGPSQITFWRGTADLADAPAWWDYCVVEFTAASIANLFRGQVLPDAANYDVDLGFTGNLARMVAQETFASNQLDNRSGTVARVVLTNGATAQLQHDSAPVPPQHDGRLIVIEFASGISVEQVGIQLYGLTTGEQTTITPIDLARSFVITSGIKSNVGANQEFADFIRQFLLDTETLRAERGTDGGWSFNDMNVGAFVCQLDNAAVQRFSTSLAASDFVETETLAPAIDLSNTFVWGDGPMPNAQLVASASGDRQASLEHTAALTTTTLTRERGLAERASLTEAEVVTWLSAAPGNSTASAEESLPLFAETATAAAAPEATAAEVLPLFEETAAADAAPQATAAEVLPLFAEDATASAQAANSSAQAQETIVGPVEDATAAAAPEATAAEVLPLFVEDATATMQEPVTGSAQAQETIAGPVEDAAAAAAPEATAAEVLPLFQENAVARPVVPFTGVHVTLTGRAQPRLRGSMQVERKQDFALAIGLFCKIVVDVTMGLEEGETLPDPASMTATFAVSDQTSKEKLISLTAPDVEVIGTADPDRVQIVASVPGTETDKLPEAWCDHAFTLDYGLGDVAVTTGEVDAYVPATEQVAA